MHHNPLSYSQHVHCDLKILVKEALLSLNVPSDELGQFDTHSTIAIAFTGCPDLHLSIFRDRLMIWSPIDTTETWLSERSREVILALTQPMSGIENEGCSLLKTHSGYELRALVNLDDINSGGLANAIKGFEQILKHFHQ